MICRQRLQRWSEKIGDAGPLAVEQPHVLLLDEPDNHLDLDAKRYLETFIRAILARSSSCRMTVICWTKS